MTGPPFLKVWPLQRRKAREGRETVIDTELLNENVVCRAAPCFDQIQ